ncbi:hypothetical protein ACFL06_00430 [Patescibacteria group bacterium]
MNKAELDNLANIEGKVRGATFQTDAKYVLEKKGEEGLKKLEKKMKELGYKIDYRTAKATDWYPAGLRIISLLVIKDTFQMSDEDIREMGNTAPKFSFIVKFVLKIFSLLKKFVREIPIFWKEHFSIGEIEVAEFDEKKKRIVIYLKGVQFHPIFCLYLEGYCERIIQFVVKNPSCKETKCTFRGDPYHEYSFSWK